MAQKQIRAEVYTLVTELLNNLGRCCVTACNDNPVFCSFFTGQDIKSDGFSIETCKIMVDLLDVSFKAVLDDILLPVLEQVSCCLCSDKSMLMY